MSASDEAFFFGGGGTSFSLVEGLVEEVLVSLAEGVERRPSFLEEVGVATSRP